MYPTREFPLLLFTGLNQTLRNSVKRFPHFWREEQFTFRSTAEACVFGGEHFAGFGLYSSLRLSHHTLQASYGLFHSSATRLHSLRHWLSHLASLLHALLGAPGSQGGQGAIRRRRLPLPLLGLDRCQSVRAVCGRYGWWSIASRSPEKPIPFQSLESILRTARWRRKSLYWMSLHSEIHGWLAKVVAQVAEGYNVSNKITSRLCAD